MVEERSLKVLSNDTTFFNKVSNTLTKLLMPTKIGINGILNKKYLKKMYTKYVGKIS